MKIWVAIVSVIGYILITELIGWIEKTNTWAARRDGNISITPGSKYGFGFELFRNDFFKNRRADGATHVEYLFLRILFLPILPVACYRVYSEDRAIVGTERWSIKEVLEDYFMIFIGAIAIISFLGFALGEE